MRRCWLTQERIEKRLKQNKVAAALDVEPGYYSLIEAGERSKDMKIGMVCKLAKVLELPVEEVIRRELEWQKESLKQS